MSRTLLRWSFVATSALLLACTGKAPNLPGGTNADSAMADGDGDGLSAQDGDCDDTNADIYPGATEDCDGIDNDCDGTVDEGVMGTYYADNDGDGFGDPTDSQEACEALDNYVPNDADCNDANPAVYPDAEELCDGEDNDCNGITDDGLTTSTWYRDEDGDSYGDPNAPDTACAQPDGYVDNKMDCDDGDYSEPVHVSNRGPVPGTGTEGWDTGDTWGPWDTSDTGSGAAGSRTNPYETVQEGINAADVCVYVFPGSYTENINFGGKDILVFGVGGAGETTIQGTGTGSVVTFASGETADAQLTGFTITNGGGTLTTTSSTSDCGSGATCTSTRNTYEGGCIFVDGASPTLTWNRVNLCLLPAYSHTVIDTAGNDEYQTSFGGGMFVRDGNVTVENSTFSGNSADIGGGAYADPTGAIAFSRVTFDHNQASGGGAIASEGSVQATNVVLVNNKATSDGGGVGGAAVNSAGGTFLANFVSAIGNDGVGSLYVGAAGNATIANSIWAENAGGYLFDGDIGGTLAVAYSDAFSSTSGMTYNSAIFADQTGASGNISANPLFMAWSDDDLYSNDDLRLKTGSPAIDTASTAYSDPDGSPADMGAYGSTGLWSSP